VKKRRPKDDSTRPALVGNQRIERCCCAKAETRRRQPPCRTAAARQQRAIRWLPT